MSQPTIEGLTALSPGEIHQSKGALEMPAAFDSRKFIGKWAKQGAEVNRSRQPEIIASAGVRVAGWEVWKDPKGSPCKRTLGGGVYYLLCRPRPLQTAVNRIHANESRRRMVQEAQGETVAGEARTDSGILPNAVLASIPGLGREGVEELRVPLQEIAPDETYRPTAARATRRVTKQK